MSTAIVSIVIYFLFIYFLFYAAWGGSLLIGIVGGTLCVLIYLLIIFSPLHIDVVRKMYQREPSDNRVLNSFLVANAFFMIVLKLTARIAALFFLICRLLISFCLLIATHSWNATYITYYLSEFPLKIAAVLMSPFEAFVEWVIRKIGEDE